MIAKNKINQVLAAVRNGNSLFLACEKAGVVTADFYKILADDEKIRKAYQLALSDYADQCTDEIKAIVEALKSGNMDNSTAKLLIETEKWLAQKFCSASVFDMVVDGETMSSPTEIVVKFV